MTEIIKVPGRTSAVTRVKRPARARVIFENIMKII
jgi:hypothetical protein